LPVFDKSLFGGAGDRSRETVQVQGPLDVVVLEGWCCGFSPLGEDEIRQRHAKASPVEVFGRHPIESLLQIETNFQTLASTLYPCFTTMITIIPSSLEHVYSWRLQAEHAMKAANGGSGMSDDEVRRFVDRYMPVYELWGGIQGVKREPWAKQWQGRGLAVYIDAQREVIKTERF
jgi:D-glycerate 3-kinase